MILPFCADSKSEKETSEIAESFAKILKGGEVIILIGELGAGKTYFVKKTLEIFGVTWVNSPSFSIVNEYKNSLKFYHIDFYRVKRVGELFDIGFNDYLNDTSSVIFIEWGNLFPEVIPQKKIEINITLNSESERKISIIKYD